MIMTFYFDRAEPCVLFISFRFSALLSPGNAESKYAEEDAGVSVSDGLATLSSEERSENDPNQQKHAPEAADEMEELEQIEQIALLSEGISDRDAGNSDDDDELVMERVQEQHTVVEPDSKDIGRLNTTTLLTEL